MSMQSWKLLEVDLAAGSISSRTVAADLLQDYLGGSGLAARLFVDDNIPVDCDPLGSENSLYFLVGPLTGSGIPSSPRFSVAAKSPLTGIWGESNCGGFFGPALRHAGWDGIVIRGQSESPVILVIADDKVEIEGGSDLWGKDTYETVDSLEEKFGGKPRFRAVSIGPAGENLVKYAVIADGKHDYAGRTGLGAVMGSKKLKAIVARGTGKVVPHDPDAFKDIRGRIMKNINDSMRTLTMNTMGTNSSLSLGAPEGDVPTKNWSLGDPGEMAQQLSSEVMNEKFLTKPSGCYGCSIACKRNVKVEGGPYKMGPGAGPEYETMAAFGTNCMIGDQAAVNKINELCNRLGLDTISCGGTVAFAIDCYEAGILTEAETDGLKLTWGNADAVIELIEKIAARDGVGDLLAEGSRIAAQRIGKGAPDLTVEVKGLEVPMHDPRPFHGMGLGYALSIRGACHLSHVTEFMERIGGVDGTGIDGPSPGQTSEGKAMMVLMSENIAAILQACGLCVQGAACCQLDDLAEILNALRGTSYDVGDLLQIGERLWLLKRSINNMMGVSIEDDRLPKKLLTPTMDGPAAGSIPDIELMMKEYYELRGLDERGIPRKEKLEAVGLSDIAARLHRGK